MSNVPAKNTRTTFVTIKVALSEYCICKPILYSLLTTVSVFIYKLEGATVLRVEILNRKRPYSGFGSITELSSVLFPVQAERSNNLFCL